MAYVRSGQFGSVWTDLVKRLPQMAPMAPTFAPIVPPAIPGAHLIVGGRDFGPSINVIPTGTPLPTLAPKAPLVPARTVKKLRSGQYAGFGDYDGFSLSKLTTWLGGTVTAIASGNTAAIAAQAQAAIPGSSKKVTAPVPPKPVAVGVFSPGGFVEQNQTVLLLAAAGLAAFLVLGRKGRR